MSHSALNEFRASGLTVEVHYDESAESPRDAYDNLAVFALSHRRYVMPDEADLGEHDSLEDLIALAKQAGAVAVRTVYGYDHGVLTCATRPYSCPWDSGVLGIAYITREKADAECGQWTEASLLEAIDSEVETFATYLRGEVYGYIIKDNDDEVLDSCWGYYGSEAVEEAAREAAEAERDWQVEKAEGEAYALLQALDTPDVVTALAAARQGVR